MSGLKPDAVVAVVGAGTMGRGIARVASEAGHRVLLYDAAADAVSRALEETSSRLARDVEKGRLGHEEADAIGHRIEACSSVEELTPASLVIEAIVESLDAKVDVLRRIEEIVPPDCIIATNTSSLSVTAIAAGLRRPDRVAGMHFFNPAPVMALVEVVTAAQSAEPVVATLVQTAEDWGKTPVRATSTPGFIVNRVARPFYGEALRLLEEGWSQAATIDALITGSCGFRMGPFRLMDLVGLDVNLAVSKSVYEQTFHDPRFRPSVIQQSLVDAGRLGQKTGRGFYDHSGGFTHGTSASRTKAHTGEVGPLIASGHLGHAAGLVDRMEAWGLDIDRVTGEGPGHIRSRDAVLIPTNGATATAIAASGGFDTTEVCTLDLARDWHAATTVAIAESRLARTEPSARFAAALATAGVTATVVGDAPGLVSMRIVAQLCSVAADAVLVGVATPEDVDTAMRLGVNYPQGPLEWADDLGSETVVEVLDNLASFYGEERYGASSLLRAAAVEGARVSVPGEGARVAAPRGEGD